MRITKPVISLGVLLLVFFFGVVGPQTSQAQSPGPPTPSSHVSPPEAQVVITIASKSGRPVPAPAKGDFLVRDDQHPVEVNQLRSAKDDPLVFSLLVDASGSTQSITALQIKGAIRLFRALSDARSRGYLILFRDEVATDDHVVDAQTVEQILTQETSRRGATALFDAVVHAATKQLSLAPNSPSRRRAIFLFSDGGDNTSRSSLDRTLIVLQREGIPLFSIVTPSNKPDKRDMAILRDLSQNTGGDMVPLDQPEDFVFRLLNLLDNQYLLEFSAFPAKHHKLHSLDVKAVSTGVKVSAPTQYLAP